MYSYSLPACCGYLIFVTNPTAFLTDHNFSIQNFFSLNQDHIKKN